MIARTEKEVEDMLNDGMPDGAEGESRWPGMTYEQGVDATARWVLGWTDDNPMTDD
jgi:hypothetical protein